MYRLLLFFDGAIFGVIGMMFLGATGRWAQTVGISLTNPRALTDIKATYGGMDLMLGIFFFLCAGRENWQQAGFACSTLVLLGLFASRALGIVMHGTDKLMIQLLIAEFILVVANGVALYKLAVI